MIIYDQISSNKRKTVILVGIFLILIILIGFVFSQAYSSPEILYAAAIFSVFYSLISYFFSTNITLAISRAHEVDRQENQQLYNLVENLAITAGIPTPKIYIIDDTALNAFATGRNPQNSVIVFTSGILEKLDKTELEGVAAHELSHIGNYDVRLMTLVVVLVGVLTLLADFFLRFSFFGGRRKGRSSEGGQIQAIFMIAGIVLAILSPIIATLIQLAVSRKREYLADASGALLTRYPAGLASALEKISQDTEALEAANKATAHMYIENPLRNNKSGVGWFAGLFNTHPPIEDRIKRLREMGA
jgi:heat shock protein HtpX